MYLTLKNPTSEVAKNSKRLLVNQIVVGLLIAAFFELKVGHWQALSALYGMFVTIAISTLLSRGVQRAENEAIKNPKSSMGILYFGAVQRFITAAVLFIIGLGLIEFEPLPLIIGFGVTQFAYVLNIIKLKKN